MLFPPLLLGKTELISLQRSAVSTVQQLLQSVFLLQDFPYVGQNNDAEMLLHLNISGLTAQLGSKKQWFPHCHSKNRAIILSKTIAFKSNYSFY